MKEYKVLAIGDSNIKAKICPNNGWAEKLSRYIAYNEDSELNYFNKGNGGDTSRELLNRIENDLNLCNHWNLIIIGVGVNDSRKLGEIESYKYDVDTENFLHNIRKLFEVVSNHKSIDKVLISGVIPIEESILTPYKPGKYYYEKDAKGYNKLLARISKEHVNFQFIDFYDLFQPLNKKIHRILMDDGLHPNCKGHEILFELAKSKMVNE